MHITAILGIVERNNGSTSSNFWSNMTTTQSITANTGMNSKVYRCEGTGGALDSEEKSLTVLRKLSV